MKNNNHKIASKTILRREEDMQTQQLREPERRRNGLEKKHYPSIAERVAQSSVCYRNFKYKGGEESFPREPLMRCVDQYFPYAVGGELLVDVPQTEGEKSDCARKAVVMAKYGYRYLIVETNMDEYEAERKLRG